VTRGTHGSVPALQSPMIAVTNTNGFGNQGWTAPVARAEPPHGTGADLSESDGLGSATPNQHAQSGNRDALEALLAAARPRLCAVALKMVRDQDDAEDVVQDAMLKVWRALDKFEGRAALSTWLHRIVVNTALDWLRARRHGVATVRPIADDDDPDRLHAEAGHDRTPEDLLERAQIGAAVRGAIACLSPAHQEVLALRELDGESYQSIATIARCPVGTVMSRLHHARSRLGEVLASSSAELLPQAA
jgi:RNA polymerase sigma-70 factor (ECF subfamily)